MKITTCLIGKEEVFKMIALSQVTGIPLLLKGVPGTAKTRTVLDYTKSFMLDGAKTDEEIIKAKKNFINNVFILETDEGTKPSEIKGLPDFKELFEKNNYKLNTPAADAEVVIINEVDKAGPQIRNSLLGIMNERLLFNGKEKIPCKWKLFVATCNEIPKEEEGSPFWDRFILKMNVERIGATEMLQYYKNGDKKFTKEIEIKLPTAEDLNKVQIPISKLNKFLDVAYKDLSDRTLTFVPNLIKTVSLIWNVNIDRAMVKTITILIDDKAGRQLLDLLQSPELKEIHNKIEILWSFDTKEALDAAIESITELVKKHAGNGKIDETQLQEIEQSIQYILSQHPAAEVKEEPVVS